MSLKVIVSHDVDHLFPKEHYFRDLIYPKLCVRSAIQALQGKISLSCLGSRIASVFESRRHRIPELMEFDAKHRIPSVFFFGMAQGLGMSYLQSECIDTVKLVASKGFDVGVHGIAYNVFDAIKAEHDAFSPISGLDTFGIRTHYVRMGEHTLEYLSQAGYLFDTSVFNKEQIDLKVPYRVGSLWEFPLHIMDGYTCHEGNLEGAKAACLAAIDEAQEKNVPYLTVLFHDYLFNERCYPDQKQWYIWLIEELESRGCTFISYREAIEELERL